MLVLTRKILQSIDIGENIQITLTKIIGNRVQLAIEAPDDVRVMRTEAKLKELERQLNESNRSD